MCRRAAFLLSILAFGLPIPVLALASPMDVTLGFASLPSAQGWTYVPSGAHAGALESSIFTVAGSVLTMNSMGQSNGVTGGSIFYQRSGGLTTSEPKEIRVRVRCLAAEGSANAPGGQGGLFFGFTTGTTQYGFSLTPTQVYVLQAAGYAVAAGTYDNTAFHDYVFDWSVGGSFRVLRDNVQVAAGSGGFAVAANRLIFGDGTGGANANAEITAYRFIQDAATVARMETWGRIKSLYR